MTSTANKQELKNRVEAKRKHLEAKLAEFKADAVRMATEPCAKIAQTARDLCLGDKVLRGRFKAQRERDAGSLSPDERADLGAPASRGSTPQRGA